MFKHGKHSGGGWWVVAGRTRRFRIDYGQLLEEGGWKVKETRLATWRRDANPLVFHTYTFRH